MPDDFKGGWMLEDEYTFQVVIDHRTKEQQALQREFESEHSFV